MDQRKLSKFPVTAPSGREYEVEIERKYACLGAYSLDFTVYRYEIRKRLFGKPRLARKVNKKESFWETSVTDVIKVVEVLIEEIETRIERDSAREASFIEFAEWDGRIAE